MRWFTRVLAGLLALVMVLLLGPVTLLLTGQIAFEGNWSTASHARARHLAPDPAATPEAVVQVYGARAFEWRGAFAMHTWIAVKPRHGGHWTSYEVQGWRRPTVRERQGYPDREWYGQPPQLLGEVRGERARQAIDELQRAARRYPWAQTYRIWPGPNSNSFTAWMLRQAPQLSVEMPALALGKDYLVDGRDQAARFVAPAPSNTGYQLSLFGLAGVLLAREEGLEFNLLGLVFGIDPLDGAIKLPGWGRVTLIPALAEHAGVTPEQRG
ncbi:uncharacterized protein DUF3750 [Kushneria sinocarnis]|uniref:Uncharacterized protein DUF3750 n=1 Tax=Kushneria sinocarnis TaxID=595502 RepID=A0A420WXT4_9GAMM|nr:DUF3750 domain-containing protein [Kushneria sinocarnis]RKR04538.1 uncharacterized protein DUF3750 [Kushneria sinocarnis]